MIPFTGKQLQLIQLLMEQSTPIALDEISQLLHAGRRSVYYIVNKTNEVLQMNALKPVMCKRGAGYFLLDEQKQQLSALLKKRQLQPDGCTDTSAACQLSDLLYDLSQSSYSCGGYHAVVKMQPQYRVQ